MIRHSFALILAAQAALVQAAPADLRKPFLEAKKPLVVLIGPKVAVAKARLFWKALLNEEAVVDFAVSLRVVVEDEQPGTGLGAWLRSQFSLDQASWALIGKEGLYIASGQQAPDAEGLARALEGAGESNPVAVLQSFLHAHPEHAEARMDLIKRLGRRVTKQLQEGDYPVKGDLAGPTDEHLWGSLSRELEQLFRSGDWATEQFCLDEVLPSDVPERNSRLVKAVYGRYRAQVVELLHANPSHPFAWDTLLRMDQATGSGTVLPVLQNCTFFQTPVHRFSVPASLPRKINLEAHQSQNWAVALPFLRLIWDTCKNVQLGNEVFGAGRTRGAQARADFQVELLKGAWESFLTPLVDGLVSAGHSDEAFQVLNSLDRKWRAVDLPAMAVALAKSLHRPDLAAAWKQVQASDSSEATVAPFIANYVLVSQGQLEATLSSGCMLLQAHGLHLGRSAPDAAWRASLGWVDGQPRWCLVGADRKVILAGETLPSPEELVTQFQQSGSMTPLAYIKRFLRDHPGSLLAQQALAAELQRQAQAVASIRLYAAGNPKLLGEKVLGDLGEPLLEYTRCVDQILLHPQALVPFPQVIWAGTWPGFLASSPAAVLDKDQLLRRLAERNLPAIESELRRRPMDKSLWLAWRSLAHLCGQPLKPLLDGLEPDPLSRAGVWPPKDIQGDYVSLLLADLRWPELEKLLAPDWKRFRDAMADQQPGPDGRRTPNSAVWNGLLAPLVEAYLRQGRNREASAMVEDWSKWGLQPDNLAPLCQLAEQLGFVADAQAWKQAFQAK